MNKGANPFYFFLCITSFVFAISVFAFLPHTTQAATITMPPNNLGLVGYWSFEDATGTVATDFSGNGNTGILTNGPTWTNGKIGKALDFDGADDYVVTSSDIPSLGSSYSSSAFVKVSSSGSVKVINEVRPVNGDDYHLAYQLLLDTDNSPYAVQYNGSTWRGVVSSESLVTGRWYNIAATYDGSNIKIYVNGVLRGSNTASGNIHHESGQKLIVGKQIVGSGYYPYLGQIDEVRIYSRALSATEITNLYNQSNKIRKIQSSQSNILRDGLVGYWSFDGSDISGTTAYDRSGNANNGTLTNGPTVAIGKVGQALSFDGSNNYVSIAESASMELPTTQITISAWIKVIGSTGSKQKIVNKDYGSDTGWESYFLEYQNDGKINLSVTNGSTGEGGGNDYIYYTTSSAIPLNTWTHVIGKWQYTGNMNTDGQLFVNGQATTTVVSDYALGTINSITYGSGGEAYIGAGKYAVINDYFKGNIDEVRIYNRALSTSEIQTLYKSGEAKIQASQNTKLTSGLVGLWSFDGPDISGTTAYDRSGNANNGTLTNGPTVAIGKVGQAMSFDGTNDYMVVTDSNSLDIGTNPMTLSAWVKSTASSPGHVLIDKRQNGGNYQGYYLYWNTNGTIQFSADECQTGDCAPNNNMAINSTTVVNDGHWHLVTGVRESSSSIKIYVDGVLEGTDSTGESGDLTNTGALYINAFYNATVSNVPVNVDDLRVYNRALSASEVKTLYNMGR